MKRIVTCKLPYIIIMSNIRRICARVTVKTPTGGKVAGE
jgi:hypothetical protein